MFKVNDKETIMIIMVTLWSHNYRHSIVSIVNLEHI